VDGKQSEPFKATTRPVACLAGHTRASSAHSVVTSQYEVLEKKLAYFSSGRGDRVNPIIRRNTYQLHINFCVILHGGGVIILQAIDEF
jgi:hypothetical protein